MLRLLPILLAGILALPAVAAGAPADLDRGFGRDGRAIVDFGGEADYVKNVVAQPDGKLVMVGGTSIDDVVVARVNPDGSPDPGFGLEGVEGVATIKSAAYESGNAVALQPDGKIVVAGQTSAGKNGIVYRLNRDGSPDKGFGTEGAATVDSGGEEILQAVAIQPDGKIVVAGYTSVGEDLAVYRLTPGGKPDTSFDEDGARGIDAGASEAAYALVLQADGKIVAAGYSKGSTLRALVARFSTTGVPDETFGPGGWRALDSPSVIYAAAVQPDGRIVLAGHDSASNDAAVHRLEFDGLRDRSFGVDGTALLDTGGLELASALALQPDGAIVAGGGTDAGYDGVVWRLTSEGVRDGGFGDNGQLILTPGFTQVWGIAVQADRKIVLAGIKEGDNADALLFRLQGTEQPGPSGGGGGGPAEAVRCAGRKATIVGTARRDIIRGTRRRDVIAALGGNDVVRGLGGADVICGGGGRDRLLGGAGRDRLIGGPGRDRLIGGPGRDRTR